MKFKLLKSLLTFSLICIISAIIQWASGYNFDHRDAEIGRTVSGTLLLAGYIGLVVGWLT